MEWGCHKNNLKYESYRGGRRIFGEIMPPRLEDPGLEYCALPPESITGAFQKAAAAVRSISSPSSDDEESEGHCVDDPWPKAGDSPEAPVGISDGIDNVPGRCGGSQPEVPGDEVAVQNACKEVVEVVIGGPTVLERGEACIDDLQGLEFGEESRGKIGKKLNDVEVDNADENNSEEKDIEKPILAGDCV